MTKVAPEGHKSARYKVGIIVLTILAIFTALEFTISQLGNWIAVLLVIALLKAILVIRDYMHIGKLFSGEEE
jgi:Prokaryotic Cytochrome C oxidase subunit IV